MNTDEYTCCVPCRFRCGSRSPFSWHSKAPHAVLRPAGRHFPAPVHPTPTAAAAAAAIITASRTRLPYCYSKIEECSCSLVASSVTLGHCPRVTGVKHHFCTDCIDTHTCDKATVASHVHRCTSEAAAAATPLTAFRTFSSHTSRLHTRGFGPSRGVWAITRGLGHPEGAKPSRQSTLGTEQNKRIFVYVYGKYTCVGGALPHAHEMD
jgi:hypothetical protein